MEEYGKGDIALREWGRHHRNTPRRAKDTMLHHRQHNTINPSFIFHFSAKTCYISAEQLKRAWLFCSRFALFLTKLYYNPKIYNPLTKKIPPTPKISPFRNKSPRKHPKKPCTHHLQAAPCTSPPPPCTRPTPAAPCAATL